MSERPAKAELETVVRWRLIAAAGGFALLLIAGPLTLACLSRPHGPAGGEQALALRTRTVTLIRRGPALPPADSLAPKRPEGPALVVLPPREQPAVPKKAGRRLRVSLLLPDPSPDRKIAATTPPPAAAPAPPSFRRRDRRSEEELRTLLQWGVPEVDLGTKTAAAVAKGRSVLALLEERRDLTGLPVQKGEACRVRPEVVKHMARLSRDVGEIQEGLQGPPPVRTANYTAVYERNVALLAVLTAGRRPVREEGISTLVQMLQTEYEPVRLQLARSLATVPGRQASAAVAGRALFDLSPEVRRAAVEALRKRPRDEYREVLLNGLRYPWPPVADHAAEALVTLDDREAVPMLKGLLDKPDPRGPFRDENKKWVVSELVRVNHLRNCLLCHAPSLSERDPVRGVVPIPGEPLPNQYCGDETGIFIRADVTYLRQDFSANQPVAGHGKWPDSQRFDYLVRTRALTPEEVARLPRAPDAKAPPGKRTAASYPQRDAVLFALRELTRPRRSSSP